jgi:ParB/RepB/Spo0J family partition protein
MECSIRSLAQPQTPLKSTNPTPDQIHSLLIAELIRSATNRKIFKPEALQEMGDSIREKGVIQPIVVRPVSCIEDEERRKAAGSAKFELVCGERRWRGSTIAEKTHIPAVIRELSDHEALKLQVIENAQREDMDALHEAEQLSGLLKSGKSTIAELVAEIGKSRATIYGRIKLLDSPEKAKAAYRSGKLTPQVLLLIARIPNSKVAEEAAERVLKGSPYGEPLSFRQVQNLIAENYMTQLKGAPFDPKDATLVPCAGACPGCPKRTGNDKELFADVGRADVCTDPVCFRSKCDAARDRLMARAETEGKMVLSVEDSQALYPHGSYLSQDAPVIELARPCPFADGETWQEIVDQLPAGERPSVIVAVDRSGQLHDLIGKKEAGEVARVLELASPGQTRGDLSPVAIAQRQQIKDAREKGEQITRTVNLVIDGVVAKPANAKALARLLLAIAMQDAHFDTCRRVNVRHGFGSVKKDGEPRAYFQARAREADPLAFALETLLWESGMFHQELPKTITEAAKIYGLDLAKIKVEAKKKPAKFEQAEEAPTKK